MRHEPLPPTASPCTLCGACKAVCPTYGLIPHEAMSARGRVDLASRLTSGAGPASSALMRYRLSTCLHCGLCESVCPAGLPIREILLSGITALGPPSLWIRSLGHVTRSSSRLDLLFKAGRLAHKLGYSLWRRKHRHVPRPARIPFRRRRAVLRHQGAPRRGRVALFVGCSINYLYPEIGEALEQILVVLGYDVVVVQGEVCCGVPHRELGLNEEALALARRNIELFNQIRVEAILSACPTCTAALKLRYPEMLPVPSFFANRIEDAGAFLSSRLDIDLKGVGAVAYHDPCHLSHTLNIRQEPRKLLLQTGATLLSGPEAGTCCGFGGTAGFLQYALSRELATAAIHSPGLHAAQTIITSCPGCKMQFEDALKDRPGRSVLHLVEYLYQAMCLAQEPSAGLDEQGSSNHQ